MFRWFKKKVLKPKCCFFKEAGYPYPQNMKKIIKFSEYPERVEPYMGYGITQCCVCGKRAFSCSGYHMMGDNTAQIIDDFISYKIELPELLKEFDRRKYRYEVQNILT